MATAHLDSQDTPHAQTIHIGRHEMIADEGPALGGHDTGPPPYGYLMAGLAACTSITLRMYADRKGWTLGPIHVDAHYLVDDAGERCERTVRLQPSVPADQRARLAEIAEKTPVTKTLKKSFAITTRFA